MELRDLSLSYGLHRVTHVVYGVPDPDWPGAERIAIRRVDGGDLPYPAKWVQEHAGAHAAEAVEDWHHVAPTGEVAARLRAGGVAAVSETEFGEVRARDAEWAARRDSGSTGAF